MRYELGPRTRTAVDRPLSLLLSTELCPSCRWYLADWPSWSHFLGLSSSHPKCFLLYKIITHTNNWENYQSREDHSFCEQFLYWHQYSADHGLKLLWRFPHLQLLIILHLCPGKTQGVDKAAALLKAILLQPRSPCNLVEAIYLHLWQHYLSFLTLTDSF